jgi:hypothetical protein
MEDASTIAGKALFLSQLTDPFRIGMLVFLFLTMLRTRTTTGTLAPLAAGAVFVAVLIPLVLSQLGAGPALWRAIAVGIVTNACVLGVIWIGYRLLPKRA